MKQFIFFSLFIFLIGCNKPKVVLICGDHGCVNKSEADQYFEENLSIEVKIIDRKIKKETDLVELNLNEDLDGKRKVKVFTKKNTNKKIKVLSNEEVIKIKENIKNKKKKNKIVQKENIKNIKKDKQIAKKIDNNLRKNKKINNVNKRQTDIIDICAIIKKCSIDEISEYLLEQGNKKDFPDITKRQ